MEELEPVLNTNTQTETEIKTNLETETNLSSLPRLEDLLKSEKEVKIKQDIQGLEQIENSVQTENKEFTKKKDEKKANIKRRLKTITGVYVSVVSLLALFVGVNLVTLAMLNKDYTTNANTIQAKQEVVETISNNGALTATGEDITISLNEPRDYADDNKELTFLDKITILFRNLFG